MTQEEFDLLQYECSKDPFDKDDDEEKISEDHWLNASNFESWKDD